MPRYPWEDEEGNINLLAPPTPEELASLYGGLISNNAPQATLEIPSGGSEEFRVPDLSSVMGPPEPQREDQRLPEIQSDLPEFQSLDTLKNIGSISRDALLNILSLPKQGVDALANQTAEDLFGLKSEGSLGKNLGEALYGSDASSESLPGVDLATELATFGLYDPSNPYHRTAAKTLTEKGGDILTDPLTYPAVGGALGLGALEEIPGIARGLGAGFGGMATYGAAQEGLKASEEIGQHGFTPEALGSILGGTVDLGMGALGLHGATRGLGEHLPEIKPQTGPEAMPESLSDVVQKALSKPREGEFSLAEEPQPRLERATTKRSWTINGQEVTPGEIAQQFSIQTDNPTVTMNGGRHVVVDPEGTYPHEFHKVVADRLPAVADAYDSAVSVFMKSLNPESNGQVKGFALSDKFKGMTIGKGGANPYVYLEPINSFESALSHSFAFSGTEKFDSALLNNLASSIRDTAVHEAMHVAGIADHPSGAYNPGNPEWQAWDQAMLKAKNAVQYESGAMYNHIKRALSDETIKSLGELYGDAITLREQQQSGRVADTPKRVSTTRGDRQGRSIRLEEFDREGGAGLGGDLPEGTIRPTGEVGEAPRTITQKWGNPKDRAELDESYRTILERTENDLREGKIDIRTFEMRAKGLKQIRANKLKSIPMEAEILQDEPVSLNDIEQPNQVQEQVPSEPLINKEIPNPQEPPQVTIESKGESSPATPTTISQASNQASSTVSSGGQLPPGKQVRGGGKGGQGGGKKPPVPSDPALPKDPTPFWSHVLAATNLPRAIQAGFDMSMPLRQGLLLTAGRPIKAARAGGEMVKAFFSEAHADRVINEILSRPNSELYRESGLSLTSYKPETHHLLPHEESFISKYSRAIPGVKHSERAAVVFLDKLRADTFDSITSSWPRAQRTPERMRALSTYINNATGRGKLPFNLEAAVPLMNTILYSPKMQMSRINILNMHLNPMEYKKVPWEVRKEAIRDLLSTVGAGTALLGLAAANGADIEQDPRSSDFAKVKIGNTRVDPWGGFQQYVRFFAQQALGAYKPISGKSSGSVKHFGEKGTKATRGDLALSFARGKLAPAPSLLTDWMFGKDVTGKKFDAHLPSLEEPDFGHSINKQLLPLVVQDAYELAQDDPTLAPLIVPAFFGMGLQTYQKK